jgi:hypothetical protein
MAKSNSTLQSLTTVVGQIQGRVSAFEAMPAAAFSQHQDAATGALSGLALDEIRKDSAGKPLPPISRITTSYDPHQKDPVAALRGTFWTHNREDFTISTGDWKESGKGGMKTSVSLKRSVYQVDPLDPAKWIPLGTEEIPVNEGNTVYRPAGLQPTPPQVPRWTAMIGASKSGAISGATASGASAYKPVAIIDYRFTNKLGIFAGAQQDGAIGGVSYRFGAPR